MTAPDIHKADEFYQEVMGWLTKRKFLSMNWFNSRTVSLGCTDSQLYLTGTGIGSITAAVYLIQKCGWASSNIHIFEQLDEKYAGGCCDAQYDEEKDQYSMR